MSGITPAVYSTTDRNCRLRFGINGGPMGAIVAKPTSMVSVTAQAEDPDAGDTLASVEILADGKVVKSFHPAGTTVNETFTADAVPGPHYYYARVVQSDGQKAWSAPIWITKG